MKRRAYEGSSAGSGAYEPNIMNESYAAAGKELRKFLWMAYLTSANVDAKFLGHLAWHITKCGGQGVEDFVVNPTSDMGHARIKLVLGREFDDPELDYYSCPIHDKKSDQRSEARMPIQLPSKIFDRNFKDFREPKEPVEPASETAKLECERWRGHEIRKEYGSRLHWSRIVPAALYWDGVQFQNRDNFFTICIRDLRTNVSYPMVILRWPLS